MDRDLDSVFSANRSMKRQHSPTGITSLPPFFSLSVRICRSILSTVIVRTVHSKLLNRIWQTFHNSALQDSLGELAAQRSVYTTIYLHCNQDLCNL